MVIGVDACGDFNTLNSGTRLACSAVAAAALPDTARQEISRWVEHNVTGANLSPELHAAPMNWSQRLQVCEMLGGRGDVHAAVIATNDMLLTSTEAVAAHRQRQLDSARRALARARTGEGKLRGERAVRLLEGRRLGQHRLRDQDYILAAMVPQAVMAAVQRAFCFYAGPEWREDMRSMELAIDDETPGAVKYLSETFLATIGGDDRFRLVTPEHWRRSPVHPLLAGAAHPDGDGYLPQRLVGPNIVWTASHDEPAIQVADFAAWIVCRTMSRPHESVARQCFELLRPALVGERGRCFDLYHVGEPPSESLLFHYLHSSEQPAEWLTPTGQAHG